MTYSARMVTATASCLLKQTHYTLDTSLTWLK